MAFVNKEKTCMPELQQMMKFFNWTSFPQINKKGNSGFVSKTYEKF
jgi:hypothetical protein